MSLTRLISLMSVADTCRWAADLRAQGREMIHVNTADMDGYVKNAAMTWGVVVKNGLAYVNDMYNGLWIVRIEPRPQVVP